MHNVTGYHIRQVIYEDSAIVVCHASSADADREVLLKIVKEGPRAIIENAKVMNEYEVAGNLQFPGILQPLALQREGNRLIMASEWRYGLTLKHFSRESQMSVPVFLRIAIQITHILEELHAQNIIHMNIRPETIVVVPSTLEVCLTGLGHAVVVLEEDRQAGNIPLMQGSPPYMAPERTGRMHEWIGPSTDLYSLGVTLYEILAGRLPFQAKNPLEWAHAHVARAPTPLRSDTSDIPVMVERIILKLLEKSLDRRYRTAAALRTDLSACLDQHEQTGLMDVFGLGQEEDTIRMASASSVEEGAIRQLPLGEGQSDTGSGYGQVLEMEAMMRASQAFSQEKDSQKLMSRLMTIIMEISGAQKGAFVTCTPDGFYTVLVLDPAPGASTWMGCIPLRECGDVSLSVIRHTAETRAPVMLNDAREHLQYSGDPYMVKHRPRSVLALPVAIQGDLQGVLYLENNYASGVFTTDRAALLQMLSSQLGYVYTLMQYFEPPGPDAAHDERPAMLVPALTNREVDVLQGLSAGLSNKEIAVRLVMSAGTVKVHVRNVFDKLGVNNRVKAVAMAAKLNLLNPTIPHMGYVQDLK
ncbi:LuxR C-terminal-related transcriptional regulator [Paenibacillus filicis]|uniref:LuxR C-terminal-related transcriptional regulator n=1 Tax=Paenibacillus filicis TaxID=669464 RepID=A0ABU9DKG7_9BACL